MSSTIDKKTINTYLDKLAELATQRSKIESEMQHCETAIRCLCFLLDDEEAAMPSLEQLDAIIKPEGFTDAIRKVLRASSVPLTPSEVKEALPNTGFALESYSNPLASIHTILKRLAKTESFKEMQKEGKPAYKYTKHPTSKGPTANRTTEFAERLKALQPKK